MSAPEVRALVAAVTRALRVSASPVIPAAEVAEVALVGTAVLLDALPTGRSDLTGPEVGEMLGIPDVAAGRALSTLTLAGVLLGAWRTPPALHPGASVLGAWWPLHEACRRRRAT